MFLVSEKFKIEIDKPSRKFTWSGKIYLRGGEIINFTDKDIVKGTGYIKRSCSGTTELEIGSVYAAEMGLSLFSSIDRYKLDGAKLSLDYQLHYEDGTFEVVPMGKFEINEANRSKKRIDLKGYDAMIKLDRPFKQSETFGTPFELLALIAKKCLVTLGDSESYIKSLPNGEELVSIYPENDIETYRDLLHYVASTLGTFAQINRKGQLVLKCYGNEIQKQIKGSHRFDTSVSDFRTFYTAISSTNLRTKVAEYYAVETDNGLTMNLGINPLMQFGLKEKRESMCHKILQIISQISYTPFDATTIGDPSLEPGDMIGQVIDGEIIPGLITDIEYKINGKHRISSVGKNPYLKRGKSKNDKNLVGILNQIQSGQLTIHKFENAQSYQITQEEIPIIHFEFASDKETQALFNASILLNVECEKTDRSRTIEVSLIDNQKQSVEMLEEVTLPSKVTVIYVFNDVKIETFVPIQVLNEGNHILNLFYPLSYLKEKTMNHFSVMIKLDRGKITIQEKNILATISGQSLGTTEVWDGRINLQESMESISLLSPIRKIYPLDDQYVINDPLNQKEMLSEEFPKIHLKGLSFVGISDDLNAETHDEEV